MRKFNVWRIVCAAVIIIALFLGIITVMKSPLFYSLPNGEFWQLVISFVLGVGIMSAIFFIARKDIDYLIFDNENAQNWARWLKKNGFIKIVAIIVIAVIIAYGLYQGFGAYDRLISSRSIDFSVQLKDADGTPITNAQVIVKNLFDHFQGSAIVNDYGNARGAIKYIGSPMSIYEAEIHWGDQVASIYSHDFPMFEVRAIRLNIYSEKDYTEVLYRTEYDKSDEVKWISLGSMPAGTSIRKDFLKNQTIIIKTICGEVEKEERVYITENEEGIKDVKLFK